MRALVQPSELRGLTSDLTVTVPALARLTKATIPLMTQGVRPAVSCVTTIIHPWSTLSIHDPNFDASSGFPVRPAYVEARQLPAGLAGESRVFDANGPVIRIGFTAGTLDLLPVGERVRPGTRAARRVEPWPRLARSARRCTRTRHARPRRRSPRSMTLRR